MLGLENTLCTVKIIEVRIRLLRQNCHHVTTRVKARRKRGKVAVSRRRSGLSGEERSGGGVEGDEGCGGE